MCRPGAELVFCAFKGPHGPGASNAGCEPPQPATTRCERLHLPALMQQCCRLAFSVTHSRTRSTSPWLRVFRHVGPAVVVLRAYVLESVILDAVADFLRHPGLAGK